jgi:hypothetical protein
VATAARAPFSAARVVYAGLFTSTIIVSVGALVVKATLAPLSGAMDLIDYVGIVIGNAALVFAYRLRQGIAARSGGQSTDEWWGENAGKALLVWGVLEAAALSGAIVLFLTGHVTVFAIVAVLALAGLVLTSPGRLSGK